MYTEDMLDQDFLVDEVGKLRNEAEGLRRALEKKIQQKEKREAAGTVDMEEFKKVMDSSFEKLSESLEDMEVAITDSVERSKKGIGEQVAGSEKNVAGKLSELDSSLASNLDGIKKNFSYVTMALSEIKDLLDFLDQRLEEKASQNAVADLHKRMTAMFVVNIAGLGGTLMTLALLCYLIMAMAR